MSNHPRGASAARIVVEDDKVTKLDTPATGTRVREQGLWLWNYPSKRLPEVFRVTSRGYEMRRYRDVDIKDFVEDPMPLLGELWRMYLDRGGSSPYRSRPIQPFVRLDEAELDRYVVNLCHPLGAYAVAARLAELRPAITWPTQLTWTHGDLILDNVVRDDEGMLIFLDAIPPCPALPSLTVVDFGRVVQSAAGYEQIRYAGETPNLAVLENRIAEVLNWIGRLTPHEGFDVDGIRASLFYSVVHMLRGARTCRDHADDRRTMIDVATDVLLRELELWML